VPHTLTVLTWGGLRGGISIALALSLSPKMYREPIVAITYIVVICSIVLQGLTISPLLRKLKITD
jgi:CPA1 family monovalent cation:H+ antiporter